MSTRQSVCAAFAAVLGVVVVGCANDEAPPPEKTFLTVSGTSAIAFGIEAGRLVQAVKADDASDAAGGGGGGFFSASVANGGSFNGSVGGSSSFSGSTGGSTSFSASVAGSGSFTASTILGPSCNLSALCDFIGAFCAEFDAQDASDCNQGVSQCYSIVNSSDFQSQLSDELASAGVPAGFFCAILDYLECITNSGVSFINDDPRIESVALQCANETGLAGLASGLN